MEFSSKLIKGKSRYKLLQKRCQIIPAELGLIFFCLNVLRLPTKLVISLSLSSFVCDCTRVCPLNSVRREHVRPREVVSDTSGVLTRVPITDGMSETEEGGMSGRRNGNNLELVLLNSTDQVCDVQTCHK